MAASARSTNTFQEELVKQLQSIAPLMASPDATPADIAWLFQNVQLPIIKKVREPIDNAANSGTTNYPPPMGGVPGGGAINPMDAMSAAGGLPPGMPPGGMPLGPPPGPPGVGGPPGPGGPGSVGLPPELMAALMAQGGPPGAGSPSLRPPIAGPVPGLMPSPSPAAATTSIDELRRMVGAAP